MFLGVVEAYLLGVDDNTGAGGANVWTHALLKILLEVPPPADTESPYKELPNGANMRVAIRRTLRVGGQSGTPLEDLGVTPKERYFMTKNDLLKGNEDLINHAGKILSTQPVRLLTATAAPDGSKLKIKVTAKGMTRLDTYIDGRPVKSLDVSDGVRTFNVDLPPNAQLLELTGYDGGELAAARKIPLK